jgi:hypothetical protein
MSEGQKPKIDISCSDKFKKIDAFGKPVALTYNKIPIY